MSLICKKVKRNLIITAVVILLIILLVGLATRTNGFAQWYSTNIYPLLVTTVGRLFGLFPFAVAEFFLYALILLFLGSVVYLVIRVIIHPEKGARILRWFTGLLMSVSILLLLFMTNGGINYHRISFAESSGFTLRPYSVEELRLVSEWLTERVNETSGLVPRNERGEMVLTVDVAATSIAAMHRLSNDFPILAGFYPPPKPVVNSWLLSIQQVSGIFVPFTIEGTYNRDMMPYNIPFVATHELAHVRGFMQEEEANFIAFLACIGSAEVEFRYSGYLLGWVYATNALRRVDREAAGEFRQRLAADVQRDLQSNREFWAQFEGPVAELQTRVNDAYLRANAQADGVRSYGRMVDLLISYFLEKRLAD